MAPEGILVQQCRLRLAKGSCFLPSTLIDGQELEGAASLGFTCYVTPLQSLLLLLGRGFSGSALILHHTYADCEVFNSRCYSILLFRIYEDTKTEDANPPADR